MATENHNTDDRQGQRVLTTGSGRSENANVGITFAKMEKEVRTTCNTAYHGALRMSKSIKKLYWPAGDKIKAQVRMG